jgi:hypothetical protein
LTIGIGDTDDKIFNGIYRIPKGIAGNLPAGRGNIQGGE